MLQKLTVNDHNEDEISLYAKSTSVAVFILQFILQTHVKISNSPIKHCFKLQLCHLHTWLRCYFPYVCQSVCLSVCLYLRREVIFQPIFKYDISTDAYSQPEGASENRFEIKPEVEKLLRKNLIKQSIFDRFLSIIYQKTRIYTRKEFPKTDLKSNRKSKSYCEKTS